MKHILLAIIIVTTKTYAQNEIDALRYSSSDLSGTARYTGMGGAFGALGGEFSGLSSNPGGIGMYQFSEFTCSPKININSTKS